MNSTDTSENISIRKRQYYYYQETILVLFITIETILIFIFCDKVMIVFNKVTILILLFHTVKR